MKRIISLMLALVIVISAAVPAYATGDGNFDGGGGSMGDGTKTNYWNPGMDGVRVSIVDVGSHSVVRTPIDLTNKVPIANIAHFGKVSKLSYNAGRGLSVSVSGYSYRNPSQSLPKIISTSSSKASIAAIRSYFTDEQVIRSIAGYAGMDFDIASFWPRFGGAFLIPRANLARGAGTRFTNRLQHCCPCAYMVKYR